MMHTKTWRLLATAALSAPFLAACGTDDGVARTDSAGGTVAMTDSMGSMTGSATDLSSAGAMDAGIASFLTMVHQAEIETGTLARTKARHADVKAYAQELVGGHTQALQDMNTLSGRNGWSMGDSLTPTGGTASTGSVATSSGAMSTTLTQLQQSHAEAVVTLNKATGTAFDRAYLDSQVSAHQQALDVLRQHASSVQNTELRTMVGTMQTTVEAHLKRAQELSQTLGGSSAPQR